MNFYRTESQDAKYDAQRNLSGRTHYVDDDSLRFHKSRILRSYHTDNGLLFGIIESCAADMHNTRRIFRPVIFDVFGTVLSRPTLEEGYSTRKAAEKHLWNALNSINAKAHTLAAIAEQEKRSKREYDDLRAKVRALGMKEAA